MAIFYSGNRKQTLVHKIEAKNSTVEKKTKIWLSSPYKNKYFKSKICVLWCVSLILKDYSLQKTSLKI